MDKNTTIIINQLEQLIASVKSGNIELLSLETNCNPRHIYGRHGVEGYEKGAVTKISIEYKAND